MNPALTILQDVARRELAPREVLPVSAWADRHRIVKGSARAGAWNTDFVPHSRGIMDAFSDPRVRHISIQKPTQCAGTEIVYNMVLYAIDCAPGDMFWIWANDENARKNQKYRFLPELKACAPAAAHLTGRKHDEGESDLRLDNMTIRARGAPMHGQGEQNLETYPARYVFNDELDRCAPGTPAAMAQRVTSYPTTHKLVDLGSPGDAAKILDDGSVEGLGINAEVLRSAGHGLYFWMPCPQCGGWFVPDFSMVHYLKGEPGAPADERAAVAKRSAWLRCPHCENTLHQFAHKNMMQRGRWAPDWDEEAVQAGAKLALPSEDRIIACLHATHVGFFIPEFSDPFSHTPYGDVAAKLMLDGGVETMNWVTRVRGRAWKVKGKRAQQHELRRMCVNVEEGGYHMGTVPAGCLCLETAIDVQEKEAWVRVRGWGLHGRESWLILTARIELPGGDLAALDAVMKWRFPLAKGWCGADGVVDASVQGGTMGVALACIDSGDGDRTVAVYNWVLRQGGEGANVFAIKGQHGTGVQSATLQWLRKIDKMPNGKPIPVGVNFPVLSLVNVNTNAWKNWILERLKGGAGFGDRGPGLGGAETRDPAPGTPAMGSMGACVWRMPEMPREGPIAEELDRYMQQLTSEERLPTIRARTGRRVYEWKKSGANHLFDCEVYGAAVLSQRSAHGRELTRPWRLNDAAGRRWVPAPPVVAKAGGNEHRGGEVRTEDGRGGSEGRRDDGAPQFLRKLRG